MAGAAAKLAWVTPNKERPERLWLNSALTGKSVRIDPVEFAGKGQQLQGTPTVSVPRRKRCATWMRWKYGRFSQRFGCAIKFWQWSLSKSPSGHSRWKMFAIRGAKSQDDRWLSRRGSCAVCGHLWCQILHWDMRCPRVLGWSGVKYVQVSVSVERNSSIHQRIILNKRFPWFPCLILGLRKRAKLKREDWVVKTLLHRLVVVIFSCLFFIGLFDSYRTWISFGESLQCGLWPLCLWRCAMRVRPSALFQLKGWQFTSRNQEESVTGLLVQYR